MRQGKTQRMLEKLLKVTRPTIVVAHNYKYARTLTDRFREMLIIAGKEYFSLGRTSLLLNGIEIRFISDQTNPDQLKGLHKDFIYDHHCYEVFDAGLHKFLLHHTHRRNH